MAFIRVKKIKGNEYFYLVENVREKGKIRQKVLKYIGTKKNLASMLSNDKKRDR
ncbi:hypothetical protein ISS07_00085 [Candidatus Woesearchaeota archaeon]|nr:hypothetical protein [Candidatus Woesearchaeota archaeon]